MSNNYKFQKLYKNRDGSLSFVDLYTFLQKNWYNNINIKYYKLLYEIQNSLILKYGSFYEEYPEQLIITMYIKKDDKVLEIGGNIGRSSLIISSLINDSKNLTVFECDKNIANQLKENRDNNNFQFTIVNKALSEKKLIQRGWSCEISNEIKSGYKNVETISYSEFKKNNNINYNTLVIDCEGCFYHILNDYPEILNNINKIIMENDYMIFDHKLYIDSILRKNNFFVDMSLPLLNQSGSFLKIKNNFYEVWIKNKTEVYI